MAHFTSSPGLLGHGTRALGAAALVIALLAAPHAARADGFVETYMNPGVTSVTASDVCYVANCAIGTETFNELTPGNYDGKTVTTDFGTNGAITGTLTGNYQISAANQYGGAGGTGNYAVTFDHSIGYTLTLDNTATGGGVNYFGMDLTALDGGNNLSFYNGNSLVATYTPADLISALGSCPSGYCGNPSTAFKNQDGSEQFAFVNFYDQTGTFNKVVFTEGANYGGGYEADNFTVAYRTNTTATPGNVVPAPLSPAGATPLGALLLGAACWARARFTRREVTAA